MEIGSGPIGPCPKEHQKMFQEWFNLADSDGRITGNDATKFFAMSKLSRQELKQHQRTASVPKFGSWDVNDPTSGEGFTFIFEKVKEEKQSNGAVKFPTTSPPRHPTHYNGKDQIKPGRNSSCISKICCCLCSSGSG